MIKTLSLSQWMRMQKKAESLSGKPSDFPNGYSPGGVASQLGISRQAVHKAMHTGRLPAWRVVLPGGGAYYLISQEALDAFQQKRAG